ncbi:hypothetical protein HNR12_000220 [Streptomonospora nanhaiensis]|uniref:Uncharacterized protein n=1 Tax=Streptomonospora nanhaiensis TaxID=1323731 RepID=A0A853BF34_9ACTN|nr:hypothetical protein [Streptomonospora nanhaiensis]
MNLPEKRLHLPAPPHPDGRHDQPVSHIPRQQRRSGGHMHGSPVLADDDLRFFANPVTVDRRPSREVASSSHRMRPGWFGVRSALWASRKAQEDATRRRPSRLLGRQAAAACPTGRPCRAPTARRPTPARPRTPAATTSAPAPGADHRPSRPPAALGATSPLRPPTAGTDHHPAPSPTTIPHLACRTAHFCHKRPLPTFFRDLVPVMTHLTGTNRRLKYVVVRNRRPGSAPAPLAPLASPLAAPPAAALAAPLAPPAPPAAASPASPATRAVPGAFTGPAARPLGLR